MDYHQYEAGTCNHCGRDIGTVEIEARGGRHRQYCDSICRQAAYRARKKGVSLRKRNTASVTKRAAIERELDQALHLMICACGRGIWTVRGNVQIGGLRCDLCGGEFEGV